MKKLDKNRFYVYALLDPRKPGIYEYKDICFLYEPFYIGKGTGRRCLDHFKKSELKDNTYKNNKIKKIIFQKLDVIILKIKEGVRETKAFRLESKFVSEIGRCDLKTGPLTNLDGGGAGSSGNLLSEEAKLKIGENSAKYWKDKKLPEKAINKMKLTKKNSPQDCKWRCRKYRLVSPTGEIFIINDGLKKFCKIHNLSSSHLISVAQGKRNHHQKWRCEYADKKPIYPKDKSYLLTNKKREKYIVNDIIKFALKNNLLSKRLYEVAKGQHCIHRGWKCEYYTPN